MNDADFNNDQRIQNIKPWMEGKTPFQWCVVDNQGEMFVAHARDYQSDLVSESLILDFFETKEEAEQFIEDIELTTKLLEETGDDNDN